MTASVDALISLVHLLALRQPSNICRLQLLPDEFTFESHWQPWILYIYLPWEKAKTGIMILALV